MTSTRDMLESSPSTVDLGAAALAAAIDACGDAAQSCVACADACSAEPQIADLRRCIALDQMCADVWQVTARVLGRQLAADHLVVHRLLGACVRACERCAEECARHADHHRHCAICARSCRACARACRDLLETEAFEELEKLAGG